MPDAGPFNPDSFLNKADNLGGLAKNSRFSVSITPPTKLVTGNRAEVWSFLCRSAEIPAMAQQTTEDRIYGIEVMKPYGVTFEPVTLSFFNTNDFSPRKFWEDWLDHIQPAKSRNMAYYDDMVGDIKIYHYSDHAKQPVPSYENYYCQLIEAWPLSIGESELDWEQDEVNGAAFDVQLQYKYWTRSDGPGSSSSGGSTRVDPNKTYEQNYGRGNPHL